MYNPYYQNPYMGSNNNSNAIIWVQGESGAKAYPVQPGNSIALFDSENDRFFIKTTDASGMPLPLRIFNYAEQKDNNSISNAIHVEDFNPGNYVTRKEFDELLEKINSRNQYVRKENRNNGKQFIQRDAEHAEQ